MPRRPGIERKAVITGRWRFKPPRVRSLTRRSRPITPRIKCLPRFIFLSNVGTFYVLLDFRPTGKIYGDSYSNAELCRAAVRDFVWIHSLDVKLGLRVCSHWRWDWRDAALCVHGALTRFKPFRNFYELPYNASLFCVVFDIVIKIKK